MMNRLLLIITICLSSILKLNAQNNIGLMKIDRRNFADTIPVRFVGHRILLDVRIGKRTETFWFDTGCSHTLLFDFRDFDVIPKEWKKSVDSSGKLGQTLNCVIPEMQIGTTVVHNATATTAPFGSLMDIVRKTERVYGCIGADFVSDGRAVKIDVRNKRIILTDKPGIFYDEAAVSLPFKSSANCPYLMIEPFRGARDYAIFDTGSKPLLLLGDNMMRQIYGKRKISKDILRQTIDQTIGSDASGLFGQQSEMPKILYQLEALKLGGITLSNTLANNTTGKTRLGTELFDYMSVIIDYSSNTFGLIPYKNETAIEVHNPIDNVSFSLRNGEFYVSNVWPKSVAFAKGVRTGMRLEAIDGDRKNLVERYFHIAETETKGHILTIAGIETER